MHVAMQHRIHVLLDEERYRRLRRRAAERQVSAGALVRESIDRALAEDETDKRQRALESFLAAPPIPVGDWEDIERDIASMYERDDA